MDSLTCHKLTHQADPHDSMLDAAQVSLLLKCSRPSESPAAFIKKALTNAVKRLQTLMRGTHIRQVGHVAAVPSSRCAQDVAQERLAKVRKLPQGAMRPATSYQQLPLSCLTWSRVMLHPASFPSMRYIGTAAQAAASK